MKTKPVRLAQGKPSISVFFPCYNDAGTIGDLVKQSLTILRKVSRDYEVIVVDDGSSDGSQEILKKLALKYGKLRLVFHKRNKGYGGALISGFKAAKKDLVFYTDGDAQYDVKELPLLLGLMTDDVNFVNGIKMERQDFAYRVVVGNLYAMAMRWLFLLPIVDVDCDFRLIRSSLLRMIKLRKHSGAICVELVKKAQRSGAKFRQVSVHHYDRTYGSSQFFTFGRIVKTMKDLGGLWYDIVIAKK